jgi:hypothetical protein
MRGGGDSAGMIAVRAVQREGMKHQDIARPHIPMQQVVFFGLDIDVGDVVHRLVDDRRDVVRRNRLETLRPAMRSLHVQQPSIVLVDRVKRNPERTNLFAADRPKGQVLMPWGRRIGTRLLDEHLIVKEAHLVGPHQLLSPARERSIVNGIAQFIDALLEEDIHLIALDLARHETAQQRRLRPRLVQTNLDQREPVRRHCLRNHDDAVFVVLRDLLGGSACGWGYSGKSWRCSCENLW